MERKKLPFTTVEVIDYIKQQRKNKNIQQRGSKFAIQQTKMKIQEVFNSKVENKTITDNRKLSMSLQFQNSVKTTKVQIKKQKSLLITYNLFYQEQQDSKKAQKQEFIDEIINEKYINNRCKIINDAIHIFRKQKASRNKFDVSVLYKILKEITFFKKMTGQDKDDKINQVCKISQLVQYENKEVVCQQGAISDSFYIIMSGEIDLYLNKEKAKPEVQVDKTPWIKKKQPEEQDKIEEEEVVESVQKSKTAKVESKSDQEMNVWCKLLVQELKRSSIQFRPSGKIIFAKSSVQEWDKQSKYFALNKTKKIKTLTSGMSFGELGIINNQSRACSAVSSGDCLLLQINAHNFLNILSKNNIIILTYKESFEQKKLEKEIKNIRKFPILKNLEEKDVKLIYYMLLKLDIKKDQIIYEQGSPSERVYFIDHGEFEAQKQLDDEEYRVDNVEDCVSLYQRNIKDIKYIPISRWKEGQMFGDLEVMMNTDRKHRVVCKSQNGALYYLSKEAFLKSLWEVGGQEDNLHFDQYFDQIKTKTKYQDNKFRINNVVKQTDFAKINDKIIGKDKNYYQNEIKTFIEEGKNKQVGDAKFEEEQLSNFLINKYNFKLLQPQNRSRFKSVYQGLEEYEKDLKMETKKDDQGKKQKNKAQNLIDLERIKKVFLVKILKKDEQIKAKEFSKEQMVMGNLGLGLKSAKSSKNHYFKKKKKDKAQINDFVEYSPELNVTKKQSPNKKNTSIGIQNEIHQMNFQCQPFNSELNIHNVKHFYAIKDQSQKFDLSESKKQFDKQKLSEMLKLHRYQNKKNRIYSSLSHIQTPATTKQNPSTCFSNKQKEEVIHSHEKHRQSIDIYRSKVCNNKMNINDFECSSRSTGGFGIRAMSGGRGIKEKDLFKTQVQSGVVVNKAKVRSGHMRISNLDLNGHMRITNLDFN